MTSVITALPALPAVGAEGTLSEEFRGHGIHGIGKSQTRITLSFHYYMNTLIEKLHIFSEIYELV